MPFVALADVEPFLHLSVKEYFTDNPSLFDEHEKAAAHLIEITAGIVTTANINDRPEWVIMPAAWFINWGVTSSLTRFSQEGKDIAQENFFEARKICKEHRVNKTFSARVYDIEGGYK